MINEKVGKIKNADAIIPKFHGHAKIELTSIKDGKKRIIEHDNVFQSATVAKWLRSMGAYNNSPFANSTWAAAEFYKNILGGILLFRDAIDTTNGEVEYMPAGNRMVANGSVGVTNSGTPVELGSFNSIESAFSASGLVFVYDWGTSQGNGTIGCVCLSSADGGYIGYGNPSGSKASNRAIDNNQNTREINGFPYKNRVYAFTNDRDAKKITVSISPVTISEASVFCDFTTKTIQLAYTATLSSNNIGVRYMGGGKMAIFPATSSAISVSNGSTYTFFVFDAEAETLTEKTITNNTGETLYLTYNYIMYFEVTETRFFAQAGSSTSFTKVHEISLADSSLVHTYEKDGSRDYIQRLTSDLLLVGGYIIDPTSQTIYPFNCSGTSRQYSDDFDGMTNVAGQKSSATDNQARAIVKNPLYLATVNNLETAVTKDSTQTMKVTYTITEASS